MKKEKVHNHLPHFTFYGLRMHEIILKKLAQVYQVDYGLATSKKDKKEKIQGWIGYQKVQIKKVDKKPKTTYQSQNNLNIPIIYYWIEQENQLLITYKPADFQDI